jgi:dsDNA-binding SOS-regulon protein
MAVITRYIVVRDGVALDQVFSDKKEAEAYDNMLDAAQNLALLICQGELQINVDRRIIDDISVHLAQNAAEVLKILKIVKPLKPSTDNSEQDKTVPGESSEAKKPEPRTRARTKSN